MLNRKRKADKDRKEQKQAGSFLKYLKEEQKPISSYVYEISNVETDDVRTVIEIKQPKLNEELNITIIGSQEIEIPGINKTESHHKSHQDCQETIAVQNKDELKSFSLNDVSSWPIPLEVTLMTELVLKGPK